MRTSRNLYTDLWDRIPFSLGQWPSLLFVLGLALIFVALGSDLIGLGDGTGMGPKQIVLLAAGGMVALVGAVADMRTRQYEIGQWWQSLELGGVTAVKFGAVASQFGLLVLVAQQFHLENQAFYNGIMVLAFFGFVIHYFLPQPYRQPFFLILSVGGITGV